MISVLLIVLVVVILLGVLPVREGTANWGYAPGGVVGLILVVLLVLLLLGRI